MIRIVGFVRRATDAMRCAMAGSSSATTSTLARSAPASSSVCCRLASPRSTGRPCCLRLGRTLRAERRDDVGDARAVEHAHQPPRRLPVARDHHVVLRAGGSLGQRRERRRPSGSAHGTTRRRAPPAARAR